MNFKHLETFIALADELHFGRAAHRLGTTQPAVSRILKELEREIGVKLLDRASREITLTASGKAFLDASCQSLNYLDIAIRAAQAETDKGIESLTLGLGIGSAQPALGRLIAAFKVKNPICQVELTMLNERNIGESLTSTHLDGAVIWDASIPTGAFRKAIATVPMSVLVPQGHPFENAKSISLSQLRNEPIILPARKNQPIIFEQYRKFARSLGFEPRIAIDVATTADVLAMVSGGVGIGNAPIPVGLTYSGIAIIPQEPSFELTYELVWLNKNNAIESLLSCFP